MTRTLPAGLQAHLDGGATTMVYCWKVTRRFGTVQGFTEHDEDLTFDSVTYVASTGFSASAINAELGLSVDNLNVEGALSSSTINEDDLAEGRYDDAEVELYWVNFEDTAERVLLMTGNIGEVERRESFFSAEFRGISHRMAQRTGRTFRRTCDADLGDSRCKVSLGSFTTTGTVSTVETNRLFEVTGLSPNGNQRYSLGKLTWTSGANNGLTFAVRDHSSGSGAPTQITLFSKTPNDVQAGDTFSLVAGCKKDEKTCRNKFSNIANFQGFPFIPGNDVVAKYPNQEDDNNDGGSIFR